MTFSAEKGRGGHFPVCERIQSLWGGGPFPRPCGPRAFWSGGPGPWPFLLFSVGVCGAWKLGVVISRPAFFMHCSLGATQ